MKCLKITFKAFTASFRLPFAYTGVQLSIPVPAYSNMLGLISCCAGRKIEPEETKIGFEFSYKEKCKDIERFIRWDYNPKYPGRAKLNTKGPAIREREFLLYPQLSIYLTNLNLMKYFKKPRGIPCLGRSQDVSWIEEVELVDLSAINEGFVKGTLIPFYLCSKDPIEGLLVRLPEYMIYNEETRLRRPKNNILFIATKSKMDCSTRISIKNGLFASESNENAIYIHDWIN